MAAHDTLVGMVGVGKIGGAVADHVLASGWPMMGWARRPETLERFAGHGGRVAAQLPELGTAPVVIAAVFDDAAVREIAFGPTGLVEAMAPGAVHVAMETISPRLARELHEAHAARGQRLLAAPVFGRPEAAAQGELAIMCSGPEETFRSVDPILSVTGKTRWIGPEPEQGMLVKLIGNHMILTMGELLAETFIFLRAGGVGPQDAKAALMDELMPGVLAGYAQRLAAAPDGPRPAGTAIGCKDMRSSSMRPGTWMSSSRSPTASRALPLGPGLPPVPILAEDDARPPADRRPVAALAGPSSLAVPFSGSAAQEKGLKINRLTCLLGSAPGVAFRVAPAWRSIAPLPRDRGTLPLRLHARRQAPETAAPCRRTAHDR